VNNEPELSDLNPEEHSDLLSTIPTTDIACYRVPRLYKELVKPKNAKFVGVSDKYNICFRQETFTFKRNDI